MKLHKKMRRSACFFTFFTLLAPTSAVLAAVITVGPGQSIQTAVNQAVAGDTVRVLAGTYTQKVVVSKSGTASSLITLKGDPGAIISGLGLRPVDREGLITIRNASNVRVEGFDVGYFTTPGGATPVGILVEGRGTNVQVVNNKIHDIKNTNACTTSSCSEGAHGLAVFGTDTTGYKNILLQKNEVYRNVLAYSEALVINGNVDGFEVLNNDVHDNNNIGYDFIGYEGECNGCGELDRARNGVVRNNRAANNSSATNPAYKGSLAAGGFYVDGGRHIVFDGNVSTGNDIGFEFASEHTNTWSEDILMFNNFIYRNKAAGLALGGYDTTVGAARRINVTNNSFYKNKGWGTEVVFQQKVTNSTFANNIFYGAGTLAENYKTLGSGYSGNVWGTNLWWGTASSTTNLPGNRVIANPMYVAPDSGNLYLTATSPAIDAGVSGVPISTWTAPVFSRYYPAGAIPASGTVDYGGGVRITGTLDLGADEYSGAPPVTTMPASPSLLTATAVSSSQINVTWSDNALNETGVRVERSQSESSNFVEVFIAPSNSTSWQDTSLQAVTKYFYRVRSTNSAGNSPYSGVAGATTSAAAPGGTPNIVVDGIVSDWANIASLSAPGTGGVTALRAHADATYLYLLVNGTVGTNYAVFLNTDNLTTTGISSSYWTPEGSDYMLENGVLYKHAGAVSTWSWTKLGVLQTGIQAVKKTGVLEIRIPRAALVGSAKAVRIGVEYSNSSWSTTGTIPSANGPQAQFTF